MQSFFVFFAAASLCVTIADSAAAQQSRPGRPYRGLFGGRVDNPEQLLTLSGTAGIGYDTNVLLETGGFGGGTGDPRAGTSSVYESLGASLSYTLHKGRIDFGASSWTDARYYQELSGGWVPAYGGSIATTFHTSKKSHVRADYHLTYQPFLTLIFLPALNEPELGQAPPPNLDFGAESNENLTNSIGVEYGHELSKRWSVNANYISQATSFNAQPERDFSLRQFGARASYNIARGLSARIGYGYSEGYYPEGFSDSRGHTLDAGIDFARALSLSRRTTLAFGTGSSATVYQDETHYRFLGNATLSREIGRTWNVGLAYNRTVELLAAYAEPVLGDAVTAGVGGMLNHRLQVNASAGVFIGHVGYSSGQNAFDTYMAGANAQFAISRQMALRINYSYFFYSYDPGALPLVNLLVPTSDRHSVQANFVVWAPFFYRPRKPDAAR
jgi:hypothetical protein